MGNLNLKEQMKTLALIALLGLTNAMRTVEDAPATEQVCGEDVITDYEDIDYVDPCADKQPCPDFGWANHPCKDVPWCEEEQMNECFATPEAEEFETGEEECFSGVT